MARMDVPIDDPNVQLAELVKRVEAGEDVVLTRDGKPAIRMLSVDAEAKLAARNRKLLELSAEMARLKHPGPDGAHASDFLFDDKTGLPV